jgi:ABC-type amino acid transport substrate-binding protein
MKKQVVVVLFLLVVMIVPAFAQEKAIVLGYKDEAKMPFINALSNNSGAWQELFSKATGMIGYKLEVLRLPKKRVLAGLMDGSLDFYPDFTFTDDRIPYSYWMDNGFTTKSVIVTRKDVPEITDLKKFKGNLLAEPGSSEIDKAKNYPDLKVVQMQNLTMDGVEKALNAKRGDLFIVEIEVVDYFKKEMKIKNWEDVGLKIHTKAQGDFAPCYAGFSRKSKYYKEIPNPKYDASKPVTLANFPVVVSPDCVAAKFADALLKLKANGEAPRIYAKYFK